MNIPLKHPDPDFAKMEKVLKGEAKPERVHFVEELVDPEVIDYITQNVLEEDFPSIKATVASMCSNDHLMEKALQFARTGQFRLLGGEEDKIRILRDINYYYRLGYDYVPDLAPWTNMWFLFELMVHTLEKSLYEAKKATDTANVDVSRGMRNWQDEHAGLISSWDDFHAFPWHKIDLDVLGLDEYYEFLTDALPEGMKVPVVGTLFDPGVIGLFFGFEQLCLFLYDSPELVKAVVDAYGQKMCELYERIISYDCVGFLWHADDLGHKNQTIISSQHIRQYLLPWFRKYASIAHAHAKTVWLHSCGNMYTLMDELIDEVKIDAKHSFEDVILPVVKFKEMYGQKVATLGGVDMDKLCRLEEGELRRYCREILEKCMHGGRYAYGSGNTIANYIPLKNYFIMIEEGLNFKP